MKTTLIKILRTKIIVMLIFAFGCSEDFLNDPQPTDQVSSDIIYGSRTGANAFMAGILRRMRGQFVANNHDAGGLNSMLYARTVKGNDIVQANTWFNFDYANDNREPTYRRVTFSWNFSYHIIGQLNNFIAGVEASETLGDDDKKELIAQGKALRAYYYHQLVLEFSPAYSVDPNYAAPPLYLEFSPEGGPMSTVQEVYNAIITDLTDAVGDLTDDRLDKSFVNYRVANAFLAQAYLAMGRYEEAGAAAHEAYGGDVNAALDAGSYDDGFNSLENKEWIWGLPQYDDQSAYYYSAPHAHADHYVLSYQGTYINSDFVGLFSETDVRNLFVAGAYGTTFPHWAHYITTKFQFTFDADIPVIRTPEMILTEAEALYRNDQEDEAHTLLYALQVNRDPEAVKSTNTGEDLLEEILIERRKELYAECGIEWFDAKRLGRGIPRVGVHRVSGAAVLGPNDNRFFLKIPQAEIDANENIDESVNANR